MCKMEPLCDDVSKPSGDINKGWCLTAVRHGWTTAVSVLLPELGILVTTHISTQIYFAMWC